VLLATISVALSLALAEAVCRLFLPQPGYVESGPPYGDRILAPHPIYGYTHAANVRSHVWGDGYDLIVQTGELGLRARPGRPSTEPLSDPGEWTILAVGDSLTFGWGVEDEESWPAQLELQLRRRGVPAAVLNAAVTASSLAQIRSRANDLIPRLEPRLAMVGVLPSAVDRLEDPFALAGDTLIRSSMIGTVSRVEEGFLHTIMHRPWMRAADLWLCEHWFFGAHLWRGGYRAWRPLRSPPPVSGSDGLEPARERTENRPGFDTADDMVPLLAELERLVADLGKKRLPLVVLILNMAELDGGFDPAGNNPTIERWCRERGIPVLDTARVLRHPDLNGTELRLGPLDGHLTAPAFEHIGSAAADLLIRERLAPVAGAPTGGSPRPAPR
jgi:hypothetical protein